MLHHRGLSKSLWAEACNTAVFLLNHAVPIPVSPELSPIEAWTKKINRLKIERLRVFRTKCFVLVPKEQCQKWGKKAIPGIFLVMRVLMDIVSGIKKDTIYIEAPMSPLTGKS